MDRGTGCSSPIPNKAIELLPIKSLGLFNRVAVDTRQGISIVPKCCLRRRAGEPV